MSAFVVREGDDSCPYGCGEDIVLVKCLPTGNLVGWCWVCECTLPIPYSEDYQFTEAETVRDLYAPTGLILPEWSEIRAAGLDSQVIRSIPVAQWHGLNGK